MAVQPSIAGKITLGYYLIGAVILSLALVTFFELYQVEEKVASGERISSFLNATLEFRRFEKNYFLYGQLSELREGQAYVDAAQRLLDERADFDALVGPQRTAVLSEDLERYRRLLEQAATGPAEGAGWDALERDIRAVGKRIVTVAEEMSGTERRLLQESLSTSRRLLLVSVLALIAFGVLIGRVLSRMVVRPLKQLEDSMEEVASGEVASIDIPSRDREILSLTRAFNRMLEELESKHAHLVRSQKLASLGTLLAGVAHELNNPLSNISTSCQILLEEIDEADPAAQRELLGQIDEQTERARTIVRTLLEFARDRPFRTEPLAVGALFQDTLRFMRGQVPAGVRLRVEAPADLQVLADKQRMQQVCLNLVKNAIESLEGRGEVVLRARGAPLAGRYPTKCRDAEAAAEIEIRDNGHGIAPEVLARVFDPFFTTKEVGKGAGLGLSIVHEIIEEHAGCIAVESRPGEGTAFFIRLPRAGRQGAGQADGRAA